MYKYELHMHTSECDRDAYLSARELVHLYKNAGYDGMVVTDHYIERFYTLWFPEEVTGLTHEQQVTRWLKGCRTAREEALAKKCFLQPYETAQKALGAAFVQLGADAKVIAMPCGGSTLPCTK